MHLSQNVVAIPLTEDKNEDHVATYNKELSVESNWESGDVAKSSMYCFAEASLPLKSKACNSELTQGQNMCQLSLFQLRVHLTRSGYPLLAIQTPWTHRHFVEVVLQDFCQYTTIRRIRSFCRDFCYWNWGSGYPTKRLSSTQQELEISNVTMPPLNQTGGNCI